MESEAWRCRRTDGRKWRCGMNVVPDQKYCDRHMHRGRLRSRKPVELEPPPSVPHFQSPPAVGKTSAAPTQLPPATVSAIHAATRPAERSVPSSLATAKVQTEAAASVSTNGDECSYGNITTGSRKHSHSSSNNNNAAQGLDFSPKSVLPVERCSGSCFHGVISSEDEPGRCRRTDGKKWRCRRVVVNNLKYCERHLHRGKRRQELHPAVPSAIRQEPAYSKMTRKADCGSLKATLTTDIQIAAAAAPSPLLVTRDNVSTASTSSDATISDDGFMANNAN